MSESKGTNRYQAALRWLLLPYLSGAILLLLLPALFSFFLAFWGYDGLSAPRWLGLTNFKLVITDELFWLSIQNSLALILIPVPLRVAGAFLLARMGMGNGRSESKRKQLGLRLWRTVIYLPSVIPPAAYALAWLWILNPLYGPLNGVLREIGIVPPHWFADPVWAKPGLVLLGLWQIGEGFLVSMAVLYDLPPELEEAAKIDGAGSWQRLRHLLLPLAAPILLLLSLRDALLSFQESFSTILLTTGGGPYYSTYTLPLFVYEQGFDLLSFGTASAALWVIYLLSGLVVGGMYLIARQWGIGVTDETLF